MKKSKYFDQGQKQQNNGSPKFGNGKKWVKPTKPYSKRKDDNKSARNMETDSRRGSQSAPAVPHASGGVKRPNDQNASNVSNRSLKKHKSEREHTRANAEQKGFKRPPPEGVDKRLEEVKALFTEAEKALPLSLTSALKAYHDACREYYVLKNQQRTLENALKPQAIVAGAAAAAREYDLNAVPKDWMPKRAINLPRVVTKTKLFSDGQFAKTEEAKLKAGNDAVTQMIVRAQHDILNDAVNEVSAKMNSLVASAERSYRAKPGDADLQQLPPLDIFTEESKAAAPEGRCGCGR
jgi:hypothetical protein